MFLYGAERLDRAEVRADRFEHHVEQRFSRIDERFDHMERRLAAMNDHMNARLADVHKAITVQTRWFLAAAATIAALYPLIQQLAARLVGS